MALAITSGYTVSSGEVWTPTKHNLSTVPVIQQGTATLTGRTTAATGPIEELTPAQARTILGLATTDTPTFAGLVVSTTAPSGAGITALFASPPALGGTTPAAVAATTAAVGTGSQKVLVRSTSDSVIAGANVQISIEDHSNATNNDHWQIGTRATEGELSIANIGAGVRILRLSGTTCTLPVATASTTTGTGGLVVAGGVGIAGAVWIGGTCNAPVFNVTSARRFKKNIRSLTGLAELLRLRPVWYDEKKGLGRKRLVGFVAEEVQKVLPSMVAKDGNGRVAALNYSQLVALAVAGLQEHETRLRKLERKVA